VENKQSKSRSDGTKSRSRDLLLNFASFSFCFQRFKLETSNSVRSLSTKITIYNYKTMSKGRNLSHVTYL